MELTHYVYFHTLIQQTIESVYKFLCSWNNCWCIKEWTRQLDMAPLNMILSQKHWFYKYRIKYVLKIFFCRKNHAMWTSITRNLVMRVNSNTGCTYISEGPGEFYYCFILRNNSSYMNCPPCSQTQNESFNWALEVIPPMAWEFTWVQD